MKRHGYHPRGSRDYDDVSLGERLDRPSGMLIWLAIAPLFWLAALIVALIFP